jgi:hypothetical protein
MRLLRLGPWRTVGLSKHLAQYRVNLLRHAVKAQICGMTAIHGAKGAVRAFKKRVPVKNQTRWSPEATAFSYVVRTISRFQPLLSGK